MPDGKMVVKYYNYKPHQVFFGFQPELTEGVEKHLRNLPDDSDCHYGRSDH